MNIRNLLRLIVPCVGVLLIMVCRPAHAQIGFNSPAGVKPRLDAEVYTNNGFLVQQKYQYSPANPNASLNTLSCATTPPTLMTTAGILLDPGGAGNYSANQNCGQYVSIPVSVTGVLGIELQFLELDTEAGIDRVLIGEDGPDLLTYSGNIIPETIYVSGNGVRVRFVANGNTTVGAGFRLQWRTVTAVPGILASAAAIGFGRALYVDALKGAVMGGNIATSQAQNAGLYSTAFGYRNAATGIYATALGYANIASNPGSTAFGYENISLASGSTAFGLGNTAGGSSSTAFGQGNTASGFLSTAFGFGNTASGNYSMAIGYQNTAGGLFSTAMGYRVATGTNSGVFIIGDSDPLNQGVTGVGIPDQFVARFRNGYYLITSGNNPRTGVVAGAGATSWATVSDSTRKERFLPIDGPELLRKISGMKLTTWNYKEQRDQRHYGPMAQEFNTLFGRDALGPIGCDTLISTQDIEGLTLSAVQALVRENEALKTEVQQLKTEVTQLKLDSSGRLTLLEQTMFNRRDRVIKLSRHQRQP